MEDAVQVLRDPRDANATQVQGRLQQAQAVLGEVRAVLDNTLAAATLLSRETPLARQPVALDFLVELTLGDLAAEQLDRLTVEWLTDIDTLRVDPGLVRLALRNLLHNAFLHGGPRVQVGLRLEELPASRSLRLVVADDGPGIAAHRLHPQQVDSPAGRRRLGLDVVRQVMALHGGQLVLGNALPRGFLAQLVFPLPAEAAGNLLADEGVDVHEYDDFGDFEDVEDLDGVTTDPLPAAPPTPPRQAGSSGARKT
jgi:signal transduction histidine kinase